MSFRICPECGAECTAYRCEECGRIELTVEQVEHDVLAMQAGRVMSEQTMRSLLERVESLEQTAQRRLDDLSDLSQRLAATKAALDEACEIALSAQCLPSTDSLRIGVLSKVGR